MEGSKAINVYKVGTGEVQNIFALEGANITVSLDGSSIVASRNGEMPETYLYDGMSYVKQVLEPQLVSILEMYLNDYTGKLVKFRCFVPGETTLMAYENESDVLSMGLGARLEVDQPITSGYYWITGEVIGKEISMFDGNWTNIEYPKIRVQLVEMA